jgi:hypothetical protein
VALLACGSVLGHTLDVAQAALVVVLLDALQVRIPFGEHGELLISFGLTSM